MNSPYKRTNGVGPVQKGGVCKHASVCLGSLTMLVGLMLLYAYMYSVIRGRGGSAGVSGSTSVDCGPRSAHHGSANGGAGSGALAAAMRLLSGGRLGVERTVIEDGDESDPDAWLDKVGEKGHFPLLTKSHYADMHGPEPFERPDLKPFELHVYPTDEWYDLAKRATDRCDLELTRQPERWPGAVKTPTRSGGVLTDADYGLEDKVVWVSGLFDLKRGEAAMGDFHRPMAEYFRRFQNVLDRGFQMIIYIPQEFEKDLIIDKSRIHVIHMTMAELREYFPYYERVQAIRTSKLWNTQAVLTGWLSTAPQARLPDYNPLVMSKLLLLRDAAKLNPWGARYHLWMDAGHLCAPSQNVGETSMYREHMSKGMFVTHWPYATTTEVHGMTDKAIHMYMAQAEDPLQIVRGGIFGGMYPYISCVLRAYMIVLQTTLRDGYLGTEECIWAIVHRRFPHLFSSFDNNSLGGYGDNCASFTANADREKEVKAGTKTTFVSPPVPDRPTWWEEAQRMSGGGSVRGAGDGASAVKALLKVGGFGVKAAEPQQ